MVSYCGQELIIFTFITFVSILGAWRTEAKRRDSASGRGPGARVLAGGGQARRVWVRGFPVHPQVGLGGLGGVAPLTCWSVSVL